VALGLVSDSVETASNTPMFLPFLPFLGIGNSAVIATGWCVVIALLSYLWAKRLFNRRASV
jgi:ABC-2 type transport system permease protein